VISKRVMSQHSSKLVKMAGAVGSFTLVSRVLGFVRDAVVAWLLGAGPVSDAFFVAFRIPNLMRKFFSDGVLTLSFVPVFTIYLLHGGKTQAFAMARSSFLLLSTAGAGFVVAGIAGAPMVVGVIAPGFIPGSDAFAMAVLLARVMMPYVLCVIPMAVSMAVLNSMGHFAVPAAAPIVLNLGMILLSLAISPLVSSPALALALGLLLGGILQFSMQIPFLWSFGFRFFQKVRFLHPGVLEALKRMLPSIVGAAGFQINLFAVTIMASTLPLGSISYLYYAERLVEFPMALFAVSVSTVLLPELSRKKGLSDPLALSRIFTRAIKGVFFITIPAMVGLAVLREPVVSLLFQQGVFDHLSVKETAATLLYFCMGLWAFSGTRLLVTLFHSLGDVVTPFWAGLSGILFNLAAGFFLGNTMGHRGLALSVSLAAAINFFILMIRALVHMDLTLVRSIALLACRSLFASVMMYLPVAYMVPLATALPSKADLLVRVAGAVILGSMIYVGIFMVISGSRLGLVYKMVERR